MSTPTVHGSCILLGDAGVLLRGASGSGKSTLAAHLVRSQRASGGYATFVADDRVALAHWHGRIVATAPAATAGLWERSGLGIVRVAHEDRAVLRLVVDLVAAADIDRLPESDTRSAEIKGVRLPRVVVPARACDLAAPAVFMRLDPGAENLFADGE